MGFKIKAADGAIFEVPDKEYYFNTKARARRMMFNSLSSDARRVYACLELATMGWQQELAVIMDAGEKRPLTPGDIRQQTGLLKQNVTRGLAELEDAGLAQRVSDDKRALRNGHIQIYSWAVPRPACVEGQGNHARLPSSSLPPWFPESWEPIKTYISRNRYSLIEDEGIARDYFEDIAEAARAYQEAEMVLARELEPVRARPPKRGRILIDERTERYKEKEPPPPPPFVNGSSQPVPAKAEEEDRSLYQKFKAQYPAAHFDEAKAKPFFEGKTPKEQTRILQRLRIYLSCERWKDEDGRWIPLASNWLKTCDTDPPPSLKKGKVKENRPSWEEITAEIETAKAAERALKKTGGAP